jgi:hypothetical protein
LGDNIGLPPQAGGPVAGAIGFRRQLAFHGVFFLSVPQETRLLSGFAKGTRLAR